jgi:hypothetical protein
MKKLPRHLYSPTEPHDFRVEIGFAGSGCSLQAGILSFKANASVPT